VGDFGLWSKEMPASSNQPSRVVSGTNKAPESPAHRKLRKAAQEFEGMLMQQLLGDFKVGFSTLGGETPMAGTDSLNSLAIQALSTALAKRGGLGIGNMLIHQLEPHLHEGQRR